MTRYYGLICPCWSCRTAGEGKYPHGIADEALAEQIVGVSVRQAHGDTATLVAVPLPTTEVAHGL